MDQLKIGSFIKSMRNQKELTQKQLATTLCISEKTVSKWENGKGLPDVSLMLPLCKALDIDVNELLSGEKLDIQSYRQRAQTNILNLMDKTSPKKKQVVTTLSCVLTIICVLALVLISAFIIEPLWAKICLLLLATVDMVANVAVIVLVAVNTEVYECRHCGEKFVPTLGEYVVAPHTFTRRRLRCPHCHKIAWQKSHIKDEILISQQSTID